MPRGYAVISVLVVAAFATVAASSPATVDASETPWRSMDARFAQFERDFARVYASAEERAHRRRVFGDNMRFVDAENARWSNTFTLGVTPFADLTRDEFVARMHGAQPVPSGEYAAQRRPLAAPPAVHTAPPSPSPSPPPPPPPARSPTLPASVDWVKRGVVAPVQNQGGCGSCWAFATLGSIQSAWAIAHNMTAADQVPVWSEQQLMDCSNAYGNHGCMGGSLQGAFEYVGNASHVCSNASYPYATLQGPMCAVDIKCATDAASLPGHALHSWVVVDATEAAMQEAVAIGPVAIAIDANMTLWQHYESGVMKGTCGNALSHGVLVVGYDQSDAEGPWWTIRNSWGSQWGEAGNVRVARGVDPSTGGECGVLLDAGYPVLTPPACTDAAYCNGNGTASPDVTAVGGCSCSCAKGSAGLQCSLECVTDADCAGHPGGRFCQANGTCGAVARLPPQCEFGASDGGHVSVMCDGMVPPVGSHGVDWFCADDDVTGTFAQHFAQLALQGSAFTNLSVACMGGGRQPYVSDSPAWVHDLTSSMAQMSSLTTLQLGLAQLHLTGTNSSDVVDGVLRSLPNLVNVSFGFGFAGVDDVGGVAIGAALKHHAASAPAGSKLQNISFGLSFDDPDDQGALGATGAAAIIEGVAAQPALRRFTLVMYFDTSVGADSAVIGKALRDPGLSGLEQLYFDGTVMSAASTNFSANPLLADIGVAVAGMKQLHTLDLVLGSNDFNATGVAALGGGLACAKLRSFERVGLSDCGCGLVFDAAKQCVKPDGTFPSLGSDCFTCNMTLPRLAPPA